MISNAFRWATSASICLVLIVLAGVQSAHAQTKDFNVPPQSATTGIPEFARQAGIQILVSETLVRGKRTAAVTGAFPVDKGLAILLTGTGLAATSKDGATFTLAPSPPSGSQKRSQSTGSPPAAENQIIPSEDSNAESSKKEGLAEIVVTGTLLHNVAPIIPVKTITHADLVDQGYTTVADAIYDLPENFLGGGASPSSTPVTGAGANASNNYSFASGINLRGLGGSATLVLLNGRRLAPTAFGGAVDISQIPLSAIDRVEIVTDGASSLYGSDAVAGVVNIITKKDFAGVEVGGRSTGISEGKTPNYGGDLTGGTSWNGGGLVASFDYEKDNSLYARNRSFSSGLPDPYALSPQQDAAHYFVSVHQGVTDRLNLSMDVWATHRTFSDNANYFATPSTSVQYGHANQYGVSPELDFAISSDWTASLIGQWSREQDLGAVTYPPPIDASSLTPITYQVTYVEPRVDGKLFDLPGGGVRLAVGAQARQEKISFSQTNSFQGVSSGGADHQSRRVTSAYSELMIPLIGTSNALPLTRELRIDVSARYDHYSDVGNTTNPKIGINWAPIEGVEFHGSYSKSFQAPPLFDYSPLTQFAEVGPYVNSQAPGGTSPALYTFIVTPLRPETSRSYNFGLTLNPASQLKIELSYFDIDFTNELVGLQNEGLCQALPCSLQDQAELGSFFQKNPSLAEVNTIISNPQIPVTNAYAGYCFPAGTGGCPAINPSSITALATLGNVNAAATRVRGVDLTPHFTGVDTSIGRFSADFNASYYLTYRQQVAPGAPTFSVDNTLGNPLRFRAKANVGWRWKGLAANARVNFANSYANPSDASCPAGCAVSSWTTFDLGLSYKVSNDSTSWLRDTRFAMTVTNLFDRKPPSVYFPLFSGGNYGYDAVNASPFMRTFAFTFTKRFGDDGSR